MSPPEARDLDVAVGPVRGPGRDRRPWAAALALAGLLAGVILLGVSGRGASPARPTPSASPASVALASPTAAAATATPRATPLPEPSRVRPFVLQATLDGPLTYVSPNLGFAVPLVADQEDVRGSWTEDGALAEAGGILTFPAGNRDAGGVYSHLITVAVGSKVNTAPVNLVAAPSTSVSTGAVGLWAPALPPWSRSTPPGRARPAPAR